MIKDAPFFGFGYGLFPYIVGQYAPNQGIDNMDAHNTYLILAAEMGLPALILFLVILLITELFLTDQSRKPVVTCRGLDLFMKSLLGLI